VKQVLLLNDGKTGHFNQTLAVSYAVDKLYKTETDIAKIKVNRFTKYILRLMLNHTFGRNILKHKSIYSFINYFYSIDIPLKSYNIIISSGKDTSLLNAWLGLKNSSIYNIYIGNPKKLNHLLFDTLFSILEHGFENEIILNVAPTLPFHGNLDIFCKKFNLNKQLNYVTLLIGGDGSGYSYGENEYENLIDFVNNTAKSINWLVTTSRRTPIEIEKKLQQNMKVSKFIAYHQNPQKVVAGFLMLSETVFVTQESASMINEAISFKKRVVTLYPRDKKEDDNYIAILKNFSQKRYIYMQDINELANFSIKDIELKTLRQSSIDELVEKLKGVIG